MKKPSAMTITSAVFVASLLAGCGIAPNAAEETKTSAQAASAVAKTSDSLVSLLDFFGPDLCIAVYQRKLTDDVKTTCDEKSERVGDLARSMKDDLESAKPWSKEVSELAGRTVSELEELAAATENTSPGKGLLIAAAGASVKAQLRAWKPFGA